MRNLFIIFGVLTGAGGFGGYYWAQGYLEDHPMKKLGVSLADMVGKTDSVSFLDRLAINLDEYGMMAGIGGCAILILALALKRD